MTSNILLQLALMLCAAKVGGEICERWLKQPAVLGEIVGGILIGASGLHLVNGGDATLMQIAEIGGVLLLFEVGLESDLEDLFRVGLSALWVAVAGVCLPFAGGYAAMRLLHYGSMESIFVGAALTATSVGITARVFSDLRSLHTEEAKIVLGAAVIDDVIGLIILAAVSGIAVTKEMSWPSVGRLTGLAILFLVGAIALGVKATPFIFKWACQMKARAAMSSAAVVICFLTATVAQLVQLAPIVGAFAAGIVLAKTEHKLHFESRIKAIADIFVPIFFVMMGARMQLQMFNPATDTGRTTLLLGSLLFAVAVVGKVLGGLTVPGRHVRRLTVGVGMIPRGEVGLIFASIGLSAKVISPALYAAIILVVVLTTFMTPPLLTRVLHRSKSSEGGVLPAPEPAPSTPGAEFSQGGV